MKERDLVNFEELKKDEDGEYIRPDGGLVGCEICYVHEVAGRELPTEHMEEINTPRCPVCGTELERRYNWTDDGHVVVSEQNSHVPDGEIGYYAIFECPKCKDHYDNTQLYVLMPIPCSWNANHDIYTTGGRTFIETPQQQEFVDMVFEKVWPSIKQYVDRKLNPEDWRDESLDESNIRLWCEIDVEHAAAEWLYKHGFKK